MFFKWFLNDRAENILDILWNFNVEFFTNFWTFHLQMRTPQPFEFRICRKALKKQICKNCSNPLVISPVSICLRTKSPDNVKASLLFIITRRTMRKKLFQLSMVSVMITWFWMLNGPNPLGRNYEIQYEFLFQCKILFQSFILNFQPKIASLVKNIFDFFFRICVLTM